MPPDQLEQRAQGRLGTVLRGKYRLDRVLGIGGMAVVYKATHRNQAEFAIKMLHPELSFNEDIRTRFLREGYAANSVKHAGAVRVVDDDLAEDGAAFLVMELLDGIACDSLLTQCGGNLPLDAACSIAIELLDVLAAAHANGIVHRDVKPANLFLCRDGTLKVLDFGIARVRDTLTSGTHATGTGMLLGTPAFMSPEQALGKASEIDARADIWSVGATLFSMTTGEMVHDAETAAQLLVKLATQPARSLATVLAGPPPSMVSIVDRALLLDRTQRWSSAVEMRDALAWARHSAGAEVPPRAVIASLVATHAPAPGASAGGAWTAQPQPFPSTPAGQQRYPSGAGPAAVAGPMATGPATPAGYPGTPGYAPTPGFAATPGPGARPAVLAGTPAVDTGTPVSQSQHALVSRRSSGRTALVAGALLVLVAIAGAGFAWRNSRKSAAASAASLAAPEASAASSAAATAASSAATGATNAPLEPSRAPLPAASAAAVPAGKKGEAPRVVVPVPAHATPAVHPAAASPVARPEGATTPATRQSTGPAPPAAMPNTDPLDGRR